MTTPMDRLAQLLPQPTTAPSRTDWDLVSQRLGSELPDDYKAFVDAYGGGDIDEFIQLIVPGSPRVGSDLVEFNHGHMSDYEALWEVSNARPPQVPAHARIITWATTDTADDLSWLAYPGVPPEDWPVILLNEDATECEVWPLSCTAFLADLLEHALESDIIPPDSVPTPHTFVGYES